MKVYIPSHNGVRKCIMIVDSSELQPMTSAIGKYIIHSDCYDYIYDRKNIFTSIDAVQRFWDGEAIPEDQIYKEETWKQCSWESDLQSVWSCSEFGN